MLELLIALGLVLKSKIGVSEIISLAGLVKGLIGRIGEKDAFGILKKALDETIKQSEDHEAKSILENLKKNDEVLHELRKLDVSEEAKKLKMEKEAESRQFLITSDLKEVGSEILAGKPQIEYVEREEIKEAQEALKTKNKLLVVGKPGAGKSRFLIRILEDFNGYDRFVLIRSFFREDGISSLDVELQKLNSFILIWDDLHRVKKELVNQTINQVEQLAKDYGKEFMFIGASRMEGEYYQFKPEEIKLEDFRSSELIEKCSAYFGVSIEGEGVKDRLLGVGDGTPFYVISLFATSKERGKEKLTRGDLKTPPNDSFEIWHDHLNFLESEGRLSTSEKSVLRSIALALRAVPAIDFEVLEKIYDKIFRGNLSEFDYALDEVVKKFFVGIEGEFCSMHAVQAEVVEEKYPVEERKIEMLKEVLTSLEQERSLKLLWGFAYWSHRNKNYEDCLTFLNGFVEKEPNFAEAYNNRGNAYAELNQHERAIEDYNKAIELNPNDAEAYYNRGNAHRNLNQYAKAIEDYSKAIEKNPKFAVAYGNRGVTYRRSNQYEKAFEDFEKAIELNPNDAVAYNNRGFAYAESNQPERAIEDCNKAIELNPNYAEAYNNRGIAYSKLNQHEKAKEDYDKATELNPNLAEAYGNRGRTYKETGNYERSARDLKKASILFLKLGRTEEAVKDFSICFNLREEVKSDDTVYCGLTLFLITLNPDVIITLRKMQTQDETLREIFELAVKKLKKEEISEEIATIEAEEKREEMKILLELLKRF